MTVQKFIKYIPLDITGKPLDSTHELTLNILDKSGNYVLHKDLLRHLNSKRQGTVSTKTRSEVRGGGRKPEGKAGSVQQNRALKKKGCHYFFQYLRDPIKKDVGRFKLRI